MKSLPEKRSIFSRRSTGGSLQLMLSSMAGQKALSRSDIEELYEILRRAEQEAKPWKDILITSSVLIAAVAAVRFAFRNKISRRLQYALWGLVLLRLLLPVPLPQASFSVLSGARMLSAQWEPPVSREADTPAAPESGSAAAGSVQPSAAAPALPSAEPAPAAPDSASPDALTVIWLTGAGLCCCGFWAPTFPSPAA